MKKNMKKIIATSGLVGSMLAATLTGCKNEKELNSTNIVKEALENTKDFDMLNANQIISKIKKDEIQTYAITYQTENETIARVFDLVFKSNDVCRYESITNPQMSVVQTNKDGKETFEIYTENGLLDCKVVSISKVGIENKLTYDQAIIAENFYNWTFANKIENAIIVTLQSPTGEKIKTVMAPGDFEGNQVAYKSIIKKDLGTLVITYDENKNPINYRYIDEKTYNHSVLFADTSSSNIEVTVDLETLEDKVFTSYEELEMLENELDQTPTLK